MAQHNLDLSAVKTIEVVDGFGRTHRSVQAQHFKATLGQDGTTLRIAHDGDTSYGSVPREGELYDQRDGSCPCSTALTPDTV